MEPVVTHEFHRALDAPPELTSQLLALGEAFRPFVQALGALGLADRVVSVHRSALSAGRSTGFDLVWRLPDGGRGELSWVAAVEPAGAGGSMLSISVCARGSNADARERVQTAWPLLGPLVEQQTKLLVAGVAAQAELLADAA